eukprot:IDg13985t1
MGDLCGGDDEDDVEGQRRGLRNASFSDVTCTAEQIQLAHGIHSISRAQTISVCLRHLSGSDSIGGENSQVRMQYEIAMHANRRLEYSRRLL